MIPDDLRSVLLLSTKHLVVELPKKTPGHMTAHCGTSKQQSLMWSAAKQHRQRAVILAHEKNQNDEEFISDYEISRNATKNTQDSVAAASTSNH